MQLWRTEFELEGINSGSLNTGFYVEVEFLLSIIIC